MANLKTANEATMNHFWDPTYIIKTEPRDTEEETNTSVVRDVAATESFQPSEQKPHVNQDLFHVRIKTEENGAVNSNETYRNQPSQFCPRNEDISGCGSMVEPTVVGDKFPVYESDCKVCPNCHFETNDEFYNHHKTHVQLPKVVLHRLKSLNIKSHPAMLKLSNNKRHTSRSKRTLKKLRKNSKSAKTHTTESHSPVKLTMKLDSGPTSTHDSFDVVPQEPRLTGLFGPGDYYPIGRVKVEQCDAEEESMEVSFEPEPGEILGRLDESLWRLDEHTGEYYSGALGRRGVCSNVVDERLAAPEQTGKEITPERDAPDSKERSEEKKQDINPTPTNDQMVANVLAMANAQAEANAKVVANVQAMANEKMVANVLAMANAQAEANAQVVANVQAMSNVLASSCITVTMVGNSDIAPAQHHAGIRTLSELESLLGPPTGNLVGNRSPGALMVDVKSWFTSAALSGEEPLDLTPSSSARTSCNDRRPPPSYPGVVAHEFPTTSPSVSCGSSSDAMSDDALLHLPVRELNKRLHGVARDEVVRLKQKRRTIKNRLYAQKSRNKRLKHRCELEMKNQKLQAELLRMKLELSRAQHERDLYRDNAVIRIATPPSLAHADPPVTAPPVYQSSVGDDMHLPIAALPPYQSSIRNVAAPPVYQSSASNAKHLPIAAPPVRQSSIHDIIASLVYKSSIRDVTALPVCQTSNIDVTAPPILPSSVSDRKHLPITATSVPQSSIRDVTAPPVSQSSIRDVTAPPVSQSSIPDITAPPVSQSSVPIITIPSVPQSSIRDVTAPPVSQSSIHDVTVPPVSQSSIRDLSELNIMPKAIIKQLGGGSFEYTLIRPGEMKQLSECNIYLKQ